MAFGRAWRRALGHASGWFRKDSTGQFILPIPPRIHQKKLHFMTKLANIHVEIAKITKTPQKCYQHCPEEPQRYPRGLQRGSWGLQMTSKRPKRYPNGAPEGPKGSPKWSKRGPKRDPKGYPEEVQKGGLLIFWILMTVSIQITILETCLSKEREARLFLEELWSLVRQRMTADVLWKTLSFHVWLPSRMIYRRTQQVTAFGKPFQNIQE